MFRNASSFLIHLWPSMGKFVPKNSSSKQKDKGIPVTGRGGLHDYETSRLPHFLHSRLTDGG
jgi:hypothetical protein